MTADRWHVLVPVRGGRAGKTRLREIESQPLTGSDRTALAAAMAADTVSAALAADCGPVSVVTAAAETAAWVTRLGARVVADSGGGLNAALGTALEGVDAGMGAVVLLGDLPAVLGADIAEALALAGATGPAFVPDWEGTGTTLAAFPVHGRADVTLAFGTGSARRHAELGLTPVGLSLDRLRCDVDTPKAWDRAVRLGLGPATADVRRRLLRSQLSDQ
ncbi:MAG: 2-phospho-L-lactate guanylyltransferase [Actinomycetales bacterium]|nr:2-phospho-L-lactate guanylyltransferase [Actinomycetales bacterium]